MGRKWRRKGRGRAGRIDVIGFSFLLVNSGVEIPTEFNWECKEIKEFTINVFH